MVNFEHNCDAIYVHNVVGVVYLSLELCCCKMVFGMVSRKLVALYIDGDEDEGRKGVAFQQAMVDVLPVMKLISVVVGCNDVQQ